MPNTDIQKKRKSSHISGDQHSETRDAKRPLLESKIQTSQGPDAQQVQTAVTQARSERKQRKSVSDVNRRALHETWKQEQVAAQDIEIRTATEEIHEEIVSKKPAASSDSDRPDDDYMHGELKEQPGVLSWCRRYKSSIPKISTKFDLEATLKMNNHAKKEVEAPTTLIDHEAILRDTNGIEFIAYLEDALSVPWVGTINEGLSSDDALNPLDNLHEAYPTPEPPKSDCRHPSNDFHERKAYNQSMGWPSGVLHTGFGCPTGHAGDVHLQPARQYNHDLTAQSKGTGHKHTAAVQQSYRDLAPIEQTLGILFESIFPEAYAKDVAHVKKIVAATGQDSLHFTNRQCKLTRATLRCVFVRNHKDNGLARGDMRIMLPVGDYLGGELWLPDLDIRIKYRPGSLIIMPAVLLQHSIGDCVGNRSSLVYYSKSCEETLTQNWSFMTVDERYITSTNSP